MAVIHLTEAEAGHDIADLIQKVRSGEQVLIDSGTDSFALVPAIPIKMWTVSEAIRMAEARGPGVLADEGFADDLEEVMRLNRLERPDLGGAQALAPPDPTFPAPWTTLDAVRRSEARGNHVTLDDAFADDMEEIMRFNRQERPDPWESS